VEKTQLKTNTLAARTDTCTF